MEQHEEKREKWCNFIVKVEKRRLELCVRCVVMRVCEKYVRELKNSKFNLVNKLSDVLSFKMAGL